MNNVQFSSLLVLVCMSTNTLQDSGYRGLSLAFQRSLGLIFLTDMLKTGQLFQVCEQNARMISCHVN